MRNMMFISTNGFKLENCQQKGEMRELFFNTEKAEKKFEMKRLLVLNTHEILTLSIVSELILVAFVSAYPL